MFRTPAEYLQAQSLSTLGFGASDHTCPKAETIQANGRPESRLW
jgi:hypothetical protein